MFTKSLIASMKLKELLGQVHSDSNTTELGALLEQNEKYSEQKCLSVLQANTGKLKAYEVKLMFCCVNINFADSHC